MCAIMHQVAKQSYSNQFLFQLCNYMPKISISQITNLYSLNFFTSMQYLNDYVETDQLKVEFQSIRTKISCCLFSISEFCLYLFVYNNLYHLRGSSLQRVVQFIQLQLALAIYSNLSSGHVKAHCPNLSYSDKHYIINKKSKKNYIFFFIYFSLQLTRDYFKLFIYIYIYIYILQNKNHYLLFTAISVYITNSGRCDKHEKKLTI